MSLSSEIEQFREMAVPLLDELVYEDQSIYPEDAYFVTKLLSRYYKSQSNVDYDIESKQVCDVAWGFAREAAMFVNDQEECDWIHVYFSFNHLLETVKSELMDYPETTTSDNRQEHFSKFGGKVSDSDSNGYTEFNNIEMVSDELRDLVNLYVDFGERDESVEDEEVVDWNRSRQLAMVLKHISKRYAMDFPYDMLESKIGVELFDILIEVRENDDVSEYDLYNGLRLAVEWLELRAKKEHEMLRVGTY